MTDTARPLVLTQRIDAPWLGVRRDWPATADSIALIGDPRAPGLYQIIDADQAGACGLLGRAELTPLEHFGVACTLYPHGKIVSVRIDAFARARCPLVWHGPDSDRIRVAPKLWDLVAAAVKAMRTRADA